MARRCSFHVATMISFCDSSRSGRRAGAAAHAGLALRGEELLAERPHLEEEDVAARLGRDLAAADVPGPRVIGDEVARLDVEVLDEERVRAVDAGRRQPGAAPERHHLLAASLTA